ncbi:MAG: ferritin-like domain-containing protein [Bryobacterales bacterium]|nr:ferritin-like domain-containing protein [Bryobacterales bacterium]
MPSADLGPLAFHEGGALLVKRALRGIADGETVTVCGEAPDLALHLRAWCRAEGHTMAEAPAGYEVRKGPAHTHRWSGAQRAGAADAATGVAAQPAQSWGLAARGALVELGSPEFAFPLAARQDVWSADAARLYAQAAAQQWDPATAIPWGAAFELPEEIEDAVVQVMTYLIENEAAALVVPARFLAQMHPHFREVMQLLAVQAADEARHIEVFTRRALLRRGQPGLSTAGGQASLKTLVDEPDFAIASFLLSVLGEGTFLALLWFLARHAPDPVTEAVCSMAAQDEARHVAFGLAHLREHIEHDPALLDRLENAVRRRHAELQHTAGLNAEVFDALLLLAAGSWEHAALRTGHERVTKLVTDMHEGRRLRLERLGFSEARAAELAGLHTRNFM